MGKIDKFKAHLVVCKHPIFPQDHPVLNTNKHPSHQLLLPKHLQMFMSGSKGSSWWIQNVKNCLKLEEPLENLRIEITTDNASPTISTKKPTQRRYLGVLRLQWIYFLFTSKSICFMYVVTIYLSTIFLYYFSQLRHLKCISETENMFCNLRLGWLFSPFLSKFSIHISVWTWSYPALTNSYILLKLFVI